MLEKFREAGKANSNNSKYQFWQQHNKPIEIYSDKVIAQKMNYLHENPVQAGWVDKAEEYLYSSARDYYGTKGLIDVEYLRVGEIAQVTTPVGLRPSFTQDLRQQGEISYQKINKNGE